MKKPAGKDRKKPGRPRKSHFDGIQDMPPIKRSTRPGPSTRDIIQRVRPAAHYRRLAERKFREAPIRDGDKPWAQKTKDEQNAAILKEAAQAYFDDHFTAKAVHIPANSDRVERWLRDPTRSAPPTPENARKRRLSVKKNALPKR